MEKLTIAERFRNARKVLGLTQADLGDILGYDHTTISSWELGKRKCGLEATIITEIVEGLPMFAISGIAGRQEYLQKEKNISVITAKINARLKERRCTGINMRQDKNYDDLYTNRIDNPKLNTLIVDEHPLNIINDMLNMDVEAQNCIVIITKSNDEMDIYAKKLETQQYDIYKYDIDYPEELPFSFESFLAYYGISALYSNNDIMVQLEYITGIAQQKIMEYILSRNYYKNKQKKYPIFFEQKYSQILHNNYFKFLERNKLEDEIEIKRKTAYIIKLPTKLYIYQDKGYEDFNDIQKKELIKHYSMTAFQRQQVVQILMPDYILSVIRNKVYHHNPEQIVTRTYITNMEDTLTYIDRFDILKYITKDTYGFVGVYGLDSEISNDVERKLLTDRKNIIKNIRNWEYNLVVSRATLDKLKETTHKKIENISNLINAIKQDYSNEKDEYIFIDYYNKQLSYNLAIINGPVYCIEENMQYLLCQRNLKNNEIC